MVPPSHKRTPEEDHAYQQLANVRDFLVQQGYKFWEQRQPHVKAARFCWKGPGDGGALHLTSEGLAILQAFTHWKAAQYVPMYELVMSLNKQIAEARALLQQVVEYKPQILNPWQAVSCLPQSYPQKAPLDEAWFAAVDKWLSETVPQAGAS